MSNSEQQVRRFPSIIVTRKLRLVLLLTAFLVAVIASNVQFSPAATAITTPSPDSDHQVFTPLVQYQHTSPRPLDWDDRLNARGATFVLAQVASGQAYWRLVEAVWYDEQESQGKHHILVETLDISGRRQPGVSILVRWEDGSHSISTEAKPGEPYAANFGMYAVAPAYDAYPINGAPADRVEGMGLGDLQHPTWPIHTSYGLTWRWTIAP